MKAVRPAIASSGPYLQMRSVGSYNTPGREKEGNEERAGYYYFYVPLEANECIFIRKINHVIRISVFFILNSANL